MAPGHNHGFFASHPRLSNSQQSRYINEFSTNFRNSKYFSKCSPSIELKLKANLEIFTFSKYVYEERRVYSIPSRKKKKVEKGKGGHQSSPPDGSDGSLLRVMMIYEAFCRGRGAGRGRHVAKKERRLPRHGISWRESP